MNAQYFLVTEISTLSPVNSNFQEHHNLWNTMKHSGRTFISAKFLSDQTLHLSFKELKTESQVDSRLFLKVTSGIKLISTNQ
jgi:hypothetical protein